MNSGRGMTELTDKIVALVAKAGVATGLCNVFLHHTSASIVICENSDPDVQYDLETFMQRLAIDGDSRYKHIAEGADDMSAHIRTVLTQNSISIPVTETKLALGTWQGIYLWEHRVRPYERKVTITIQG